MHVEIAEKSRRCINSISNADYCVGINAGQPFVLVHSGYAERSICMGCIAHFHWEIHKIICKKITGENIV